MSLQSKRSNKKHGDFGLSGYEVIEDLLSLEMVCLVRNYMDLSLRAGRMNICKNEVVQGQFEEYGAMLGEVLLASLQSRIEAVVGECLVPTYSFWRVYERGAVLRQHVDRAACEISVSISIAVEPDDFQWPLWVRGFDNRSRAICLSSGDGLVYRGIDVPHWRNAFTGSVQYQMFLHYVRREDVNGHLAFDGRSACGLPPVVRAYNGAKES
ncbi:hypothetical protein [Burkholderia pyrrocinia]